MNEANPSSRRNFLKGGALLVVPVAAASVCAAALAEDGLKDRLTHLEDESAIRELHHSWLRKVNGGERDGQLDKAVRRITPHHAGAADRIEIAADGQTAVGHFDQAVERETALAEDSTLAQMAHAQGHGSVRRTERQALVIEYIKTGGAWKIEKVAMSNVA